MLSGLTFVVIPHKVKMRASQAETVAKGRKAWRQVIQGSGTQNLKNCLGSATRDFTWESDKAVWWIRFFGRDLRMTGKLRRGALHFFPQAYKNRPWKTTS
jgi:hypothetical protein